MTFSQNVQQIQNATSPQELQALPFMKTNTLFLRVKGVQNDKEFALLSSKQNTALRAIPLDQDGLLTLIASNYTEF